MNTTCA